MFGKKNKTTYLKSKEFKDFHRNAFLYRDESGQDYDILYFVSDKKYEDAIMKEIDNGATIFRRSVGSLRDEKKCITDCNIVVSQSVIKRAFFAAV